MFLKSGTTISIIMLGGIIFSTEFNNLFPPTSIVIDSLKSAVTSFGSKHSNIVEQNQQINQ